MAVLTGGVAKGGGEVRFAQSDEAEEDDVGVVLDEVEAEEVLDLEAVDLLRPVPAEGVEGLDDREAGGLDAAGDGAVGAQGGLAFDELCEVVEVGEGTFGGAGGQRPAVFFGEGHVEGLEMAVEQCGGIGLHGCWEGWSEGGW
jgi:hypothetical protein